MFKPILHTLFCFFFYTVSFSQDYSYVHYEPRDGLAGITVYDMCQDKDGFMWFATENGVSRYDGTTFVNFTTKEGLPDNEALKIFCDSRGRVWISTFSKFICYYYEGKIYTREHDPVLAKLNFTSNIVTMAEDEQGNVAFCDLSNIIWIVTPDKKVATINVTKKLAKPLRFIAVYSLLLQNKKQLIIAVNEATFSLEGFQLKDYFSVLGMWNFYSRRRVPVYRDPKTHNNAYLDLDFDPITTVYNSAHLTYITSTNGCYAIDTTTRKLGERFLTGNKISNTFEDTEGNTWFSSLGNGLFKLPSKKFRSLSFTRNLSREAFSIEKTGNAISIGSAFSTCYRLANEKLEKQDFSPLLQYAQSKLITNRLLSIKYLSDSSTVMGFDSYLVRLKNGRSQVNSIPAIKSICETEKGVILAGTARGGFLLSTKQLAITDTIWKSRCTKVYYHNKKYYIGTLNGLYELNKDKVPVFLGDLHPSLQRRITDITSTPDGTLWVATHDRGLLSLKNNQVTATITSENGLSSDNCKSIFVEQDYIWAGTNKGVNKINLRNLSASFTKYSVSDGLISDIINAIYIHDSIVYVCTSLGVSYFNEKDIYERSTCRLKILRNYVSGVSRPVNTAKHLDFEDNNIRFEFAGISFKSDGEITYRYMLEGLDDKWNDTRQNTISYPTLPSGNYTFHLVAVNKFGVESNVYKTAISIATPWFNSIWFWIPMILLFVGLMWFLIGLRFRILNRNKEEKLNYRQRIAELEQLSLRAQMNPHFIFNCLNSIQNFIINDDLVATNRYMNSFARLLRQTLDHSSRRVISLSEEVSYITTYLELEKMRFGDKFVYHIEVDEQIPLDFTFIPNMILQPFIENSIRHGILYKNDKKGVIEIRFKQTTDALICTVTDNGIGRKQSLLNKTDHHIEYHSKGMQLTFKRLELLGENAKEKVTTVITDLTEEDVVYPGTAVKIVFPLSIIDKLNKQR